MNVVIDAYAIQERAVAENPASGPDGAVWKHEQAYTLEARSTTQIVANAITASAGHHGHSSPRGDGSDNLVVTPIHRDAAQRTGDNLVAGPDANGKVRVRPAGVGIGDEGDPQYTLDTGTPHLVVETLRSHPRPGSNSVGAIVISRRGREDGGSDEMEEELSPALRTGGGGSSVSQIVFDPAQITSAENRSNPQPGGPCHPLAAEGHVPMIAGALQERDSKGPDSSTKPGHLIPVAGLVRRLTPVECERLQGFPDGWTEGQADSHRYRQLGNAVCVPVAAWIARRIAAASR